MKRFLVLSLVFGLLPLSAEATRLYKWVDADGRVYYSDRVPPEAAIHETEVKSSHGVTVETRAGAKTPEQLAAERQQRDAEQARQEAEARRRERDRRLLLTFSSIADLERTRDDRVSAAQAAITLAEGRLQALNEELDEQVRRAAAVERTGRGDLEQLHGQIAELRQRIDRQQGLIEERRQERDAVAARFAADLARFRELTAERD